MRDGEIVRTSDGHIARVSQLDWDIDEAEIGDYGWYTLTSVEIVTVAELFEAAGHPVPEGAELSLQGMSVWMCFTSSEFGIFHDYPSTLEHWEFEGERNASTFHPDLSRLPALDAWDALPEIVKAVVK